MWVPDIGERVKVIVPDGEIYGTVVKQFPPHCHITEKDATEYWGLDPYSHSDDFEISHLMSGGCRIWRVAIQKEGRPQGAYLIVPLNPENKHCQVVYDTREGC